MHGRRAHTCKKIAALAEANHVGVVPHNPLSPVSTAACLQLDACIPNFSLQEFPWQPDLEGAPGENLLKEPLKVEDGYLLIPDGPGIGIELDEDALRKYPYVPRKFITRLHEDGSVVDQ